jgi:putative inorganic carbon (HCO3(-)) transporter
MAVIRSWSKDWQYFLLCLSLWCFVPELRRLLDWRSGSFSSVQFLSLLPLFSVIPLLFWALRKERFARLSPPLKLFGFAWLLGNSYALLIGFLAGNGMAALYDYLDFVIPVMAGIWIATQDLEPAETLRRLATIVVVLGGIVGVYGVIQFISPPPWDVLWVVSAHMDSVGPPEPFMMRVFSTINSQGVCAEFFAVALIFGLSSRNVRAIFSWPLMGAIAAALVLTLVRSSWIGLVVGLVVYLILSPRRLKVLPVVAAFACIIAFLVVSLPTMRGGDQIVERLATFTDLGHDASALDRQAEITAAFGSASSNPVGGGLGLVGAAAKLIATNNEDGVALDSGFLARFYELGYLGFAAYILVIFGTLFTLLIRLGISAGQVKADDRNAIAASVAMCVTMLTFEFGGDTYGGMIGVFAWLAIGTGFHWTFNSLGSKTLARPRPTRSRIAT